MTLAPKILASKTLAPKTLAPKTLAPKTLAVCLAAGLFGAFACGSTFAQSPAVGSAAKSGMAPKVAAPTVPLLDINSATKQQLMGLKGVGDKRADDIIKGRPYKGKDDLVQKKILSQAVYDAIKDKIIAKQK